MVDWEALYWHHFQEKDVCMGATEDQVPGFLHYIHNPIYKQHSSQDE